MKNLKLLLALPGLLAIQSVVAQTNTHLKLSDQYPTPGEKITLTYDPAGTVVDGKKDISAAVYYLDNKTYPVADIDLKPDGQLLKGEIDIPATAKAFFIKISADDKVDNNNDKGYVYLVYKGKQPVGGAYASEGYFLSSGMGAYFAKIKSDVNGGVELYKKEFALYPQSQKEYQANYYSMIARSPEYKAEVSLKIELLEKSNDENDLLLAANLLKSTKNINAADSLNTVIKTRFPDGTLIKNEMSMAFSKEKEPAKKELLYNDYIKKYPESKTDKTTIQDNFRAQLASAYLEKGDMDNYHKYESQLKNKTNLAMNLNNIAYEWAKKGEKLDEADKMSKQSLDIVSENMINPPSMGFSSPKQVKKNYEFTYDMYADTYAYILFKENKFGEALKYEQLVVDHSKVVDPEVGEHYVLMLAANGQTAKAKEFAENAVKEGHGSDVMKDVLKKDYVKSKGSDSGYDQYIASLESTAKDKAKADLAKTMINQPAPTFILKDIDGKTVSLAGLKGKVVIVDFWATWCGPCKASFPGMQLAVNKYKDDPNVKFLFVDCWENGDNYLDGVKKFIADNKYSFNVLIDEKGEDGRQSKVVSTYKVEGIPTKFIIDKNGNIRFKYVGYSGTPEKLLDEVTSMVDMAGNPEAVASARKVSTSK
jgi:thiol-disulfide isomerase/thioredoxin